MSMEVDGVLVAAHELKAPLCLMRQLALAFNLASNDVQRQRLQNQLIQTSERALRQINDLTRIARLEDSFFATEPVGVRGVCDSVLRELAPLFQVEHCRIKSSYTNKSRLACANRELLYSIIYNFCTNALRYSENESCSQLNVSDHQGKIRVAVRDYGPALPMKIWRELEQGVLNQPTSISMRPGSSGLGIYIASNFAHHMHAQLGAIRHRDGTSFFVDLIVSRQLSLIS